MTKNSYSKFKYLKILVCSILISGSSSLFALTDKEKENKKIVTEFYNMAFKDHKPLEAANLYIGDQYKQHNPHVPDGKKAFTDYFVPYFKKYPQAISEIKRSAAEEDLVYLHVHSKESQEDRGVAIVDIFRVKDGKIVEHWDVIQAIPEKSANKNSMF